jgi:hypothetical protein
MSIRLLNLSASLQLCLRECQDRLIADIGRPPYRESADAINLKVLASIARYA